MAMRIAIATKMGCLDQFGKLFCWVKPITANGSYAMACYYNIRWIADDMSNRHGEV